MPTLKSIIKSIALHLPATRGMVEQVKAELIQRQDEFASAVAENTKRTEELLGALVARTLENENAIMKHEQELQDLRARVAALEAVIQGGTVAPATVDEEKTVSDDAVTIEETTSTHSFRLAIPETEEDPENPIPGADESFYEEFFDMDESLPPVEDDDVELQEIVVVKKKK